MTSFVKFSISILPLNGGGMKGGDQATFTKLETVTNLSASQNILPGIVTDSPGYMKIFLRS